MATPVNGPCRSATVRPLDQGVGLCQVQRHAAGPCHHIELMCQGVAEGMALNVHKVMFVGVRAFRTQRFSLLIDQDFGS